MKSGDFMIVIFNSLMRTCSAVHNFDMGCTLINRKCLEKHGFLPERKLDYWRQGDEEWFKRRVLKGGGNYIEVSGVVGPIYHLNKNE
jgi:hypothetical protein